MSYGVILADPPWRYDFSRSNSRKVENQYPTMTTPDIAKVLPQSIVARDAVLFLWATMPKLRDAFTVMDAWGFEYKTGGVWDKVTLGMGYYFRGQHELLLVGTRGAPGCPQMSARPGSIFREKRGRHSRKPEISYLIVEGMYPDAKRLEMFAREPRPGWDVWGNEVTPTIEI